MQRQLRPAQRLLVRHRERGAPAELSVARRTAPLHTAALN